MLYICAYIIPGVPSVNEAVAALVTPNENRTEHSITVTCTVCPESDADMCVVMAMADGRMTREGTYILKYIINVWIHLHSIVCVHSYVHTYVICTYVCSRYFMYIHCRSIGVVRTTCKLSSYTHTYICICSEMRQVCLCAMHYVYIKNSVSSYY